MGVAAWVALAALWVWQLGAYVPSDWLGGVELIVMVLVGWTVLSVGWVAWCRSIYSRHHRRTAVRVRAVDFAHDSLGRRIVAPPGIGMMRGEVLVSVTADGVKRYERASQHWRKAA